MSIRTLINSPKKKGTQEVYMYTVGGLMIIGAIGPLVPGVAMCVYPKHLNLQLTDLLSQSLGAHRIAYWNTAKRPTGKAGLIGINIDNYDLEFYTQDAWRKIVSTPI